MVNRDFGLLKKFRFVLLFAVVLSQFPVWKAEATHLRAGQITVERQSCTSRTYKITVTVYTDTGSTVLFGGEQDILDFGDGNRMLVPETPNEPYPGIPGIGVASFTKIYTYAGAGRFTISYLEPNRNEGVLNIDNSVLTTFYIETQIDLTVLGCDNSPIMEIAPVDQACVGVAFFHNPGASDPDPGDSISFQLVTPYRDRNLPVTNYRDPNHSSFYTDFAHGNEMGDGPPKFEIDEVDGTITWDAPGKVGEYNIAFIVKEWRQINGTWTNIGFVRRDMQVIVASDCTNERPDITVPEDICVEVGTNISETILGTDPDFHDVKIEAFSEIFAFDSDPTITPASGVFQDTPASAQFTWTPTCEDVQDQPYLIVFKITDDPRSRIPAASGPPLVEFATWRITVVAPAPVLQPANVNLATRHVTLTWDAYECFHEAQSMQIWRRVDDTSFSPSDCDTGMPEGLGFTMIAQIPIKTGSGPSAIPVNSFIDTNNGKGLSVGAKYCYRLVAKYPLPRGGESYVSNEVCIDPILADAPVITHVTVDVTGDDDGEVTVRWMPAFDIDLGQFPGPKEYLLERADGAVFDSVTYTDNLFYTESGLNTRDEQYSYRVILYSGNISDPEMKPIDTSALASSVWLDLNTRKDEIELNWSAEVPWTIQLQSFPLHDVFRGPENSTELDLFFVESVDVTLEGLQYTDTGKLEPGDSLDGSKKYCYRVLTRGGYGNPAIAEPLLNYSQIVCGQPTDDIPPCKPTIAEFENCKTYFNYYGCENNNYTNTIRWSVPDGICAEDIRSYNLYVKGLETPYKTGIRDTFYVDANLPSLAVCYQVTAIDRSGNESEKSNMVCNNNCPNYELPNVFSPNGDGCNDLFSAFGVPMAVGETYPDCKRPIDDAEYLQRCARFVQRVDFTVYNRWGKKVYHYVGLENDDTSTIYIKWDGRDESGGELASAVYYYVAEVTFDVVEETGKNKIIKGWVHLVR